jgi:hypothetical protein
MTWHSDYTREGCEPYWERNPLAPSDLCPTCGSNLRDGTKIRPCPLCEETAA